MIKVAAFSDKPVGVFGLGKAGQASVDALLAGGAHVYAWDDNKVSRNRMPSDVTVEHFDHWPWEDMEALVLSPGVSKAGLMPHVIALIAQDCNVPIIGDIELLARAQPDARYIGITGTNGKSTTTALIGHILNANNVVCEVGGNLGQAALSLEPLGAEGTYVLELSSYQLDLLDKTRMNIAAFLNITPDHIDRHGDLAGYIDAKKHIFDNQTKEDVAIIAVDDAHTKAIAEVFSSISPAKLVTVSKGDGVITVEGAQYDIKKIPTLPGAHNWQNSAVAFAVAHAAGIAPDDIYNAMRNFAGLEHRMQLVGKHQNITYVNDSKATNAEAAMHALRSYKNIHWIVGGVAKEGGIAPLMECLDGVAHAYLIGQSQDSFADMLDGTLEYTKCDTLDVAVKEAAQRAHFTAEEVVVLLSPACASFDQFDNFESRGTAFTNLVKEISRGA